MAYDILLQAVLVPIALSPIGYLAGRKFGSRGSFFAFAVLLYSTILLLIAAMTANPYAEGYSWFPLSISASNLLGSVGHFGLYIDGISMPFALTIYTLCTAVSLYSVPYMKHRIFEQEGITLETQETGSTGQVQVVVQQSPGSETSDPSSSKTTDHSKKRSLENPRTNSRFGLYIALLMLYSSGMVGTVLSTNLIELYFFFEFMLIPSYFLIAEFGYGARGRISLMYLLWTHIGALLMLLGFLGIGTVSGTFIFLQTPGVATSSVVTAIAGPLLPWIVFAIVIGLFVKLAAFGLHIWLPYAHAEAPTPISALLSPAMIGIGGYIIIRMFTIILPTAYHEVNLGIAVWGVLTMFYGGIMALAQDDIKRLFAYSSVSQMGYIIFGIATATELGVGGSVFQFVSHGTAKAILFMVAGLIIVQTGGLRSIKKMGGLSQKLPITAVCAAVGFLALLGFPETNGFQSEWMIFGGGFQLATAPGPYQNYWVILAILAVISTIVTAGYALWTMARVFFGKLPSELANVREGSAYMLGPMIFLAILTVALGVFPGFIDTPLFHSLAGFASSTSNVLKSLPIPAP
ncbi:MAG: NADH-quinone oxidoreductase subunit M [archaeon]|nr:NADH-quinone oxidoreductase subunit M [archaeon]